MKTISRSRVLGWVVCGLLGGALVQSCVASSSKRDDGNSTGTGGDNRPDSGDDVIITPPDNGGAGGQPPYNPLCGVVDCVPDQENACAPTNAGAPSDAGRSGTGGVTGDGGRGPGTAGAPDGGTANEGGLAGEGGQGASGNTGGEAGEAGTAGSAGRSGSGGSSGGRTVMNSCQVRPKSSAPRAQCLPAGTGAADDPCLAGADCAPGLACIREGNAGKCLPYCCEADSCPDRTHCFERTLLGATPELEVPVCVPAVDCGLAEPFPCPEGATCSCPPGLACMVVGTDRATTCVEPGQGREGFACPCDWGFVCSQVTNRCFKLCQTTAPEACATGMCQVSAELPPGWGVCVGTR